QIIGQVVGIFTLLFSRFFHVQAFQALFRAEVEFHVLVFAFVVIQFVSVNTKTVLFTIASWNTLLAIHISQHVGCPWLARQEVKHTVSILDIRYWAWLHGMNEVRELDCITDKEYRCLVTDQVPVTFLSVEFQCKTVWVT